MLLLAFLDFPGVFFMLAAIGIVDCTFYHLPIAIPRSILFPFFVHGMAVSLPSGREGKETSSFFWLLLYNVCVWGEVGLEKFLITAPFHAVMIM